MSNNSFEVLRPSNAGFLEVPDLVNTTVQPTADDDSSLINNYNFGPGLLRKIQHHKQVNAEAREQDVVD